MPDFSFKKAERLSSNTSISLLFQEGRSLSSYPLRIIYSVRDRGDYAAKVAISVPKRLFKKAVDRNLLKRRIREAYRIHKQSLYAGLEKLDVHINLVIQYQYGEILAYTTIEKGLLKGVEKMLKDLERIPGDQENTA
jgi:ribonuclease P protein component